MFTKANEWEMVEEEIEEGAPRKALQENNARLRYLSAEECQALITACDPHLTPIVVTAHQHGDAAGGDPVAGVGEARRLEHGFILLDRTKNGDRREIPINPTLRETLKGILRRVDTPYVFTDREGNRFKDVSTLPIGVPKVGIKDFRFHDLAHICQPTADVRGGHRRREGAAGTQVHADDLAVRPPRPVPQGRRHLPVWMGRSTAANYTKTIQSRVRTSGGGS